MLRVYGDELIKWFIQENSSNLNEMRKGFRCWHIYDLLSPMHINLYKLYNYTLGNTLDQNIELLKRIVYNVVGWWSIFKNAFVISELTQLDRRSFTKRSPQTHLYKSYTALYYKIMLLLCILQSILCLL